MILRVLTVVAVVIVLLFVGWSMLVMTGGRDWIAASMTTETKEEPPAVAAKADTTEQAANEAEASKPAEAQPAQEEKPMDEAKPAEEAIPAPEAESTEEAGASEAKPQAESAATADAAGNPAETAKSAEKGSLKSPYADNYESVAEEGHKKYMAAGCNGCHGGTGGGGMGPPLTNPVWVYGNDGDTLFRLIARGTVDFQKQGYSRKGSENVVGPMPPMGNIVKSNDDLWKIIAWIWSVNPPKSAAADPQ